MTTNTTNTTSTTGSSGSSSSSSSTSTIDPNHYVTNPPSTFCKIYNVQSKPELNDQYGLIVSYDISKQRYMIVLCHNQSQIIALKLHNISIITNMNIRDTIISQYQMIRYNIQIQQQIQMIQNYILQSILIPLFHTLRIPFTPQIYYFYILIFILILILWYIIGITKLLILITITFVILSLIGSDLLNGKQTVRQLFFQTLPKQYMRMIQNELPLGMGSYMIKKPWLLRTFTSLLLFFLTYTLFGTPTHSRLFHTLSSTSTTRRPVSAASSFMSSTVSSFWNNNHNNNDTKNTIPSQMSRKNQEYYYQLGFNDATQQLDYGTSLIKTRGEEIVDGPNNNKSSSTVVVVNEDGTTTTSISSSSSSDTVDDPYAWKNTPDTTTPKKTRYDNDPRIQDDHDLDYYPTITQSTTTSKKASPFSFSTLMAIFTIYRILQPIVMMSIQHDHHFNLQQFIIHLQTQMNPWKIMIVLFSLYRIIMAFM